LARCDFNYGFTLSDHRERLWKATGENLLEAGVRYVAAGEPDHLRRRTEPFH